MSQSKRKRPPSWLRRAFLRHSGGRTFAEVLNSDGEAEAQRLWRMAEAEGPRVGESMSAPDGEKMGERGPGKQPSD